MPDVKYDSSDDESISLQHYSTLTKGHTQEMFKYRVAAAIHDFADKVFRDQELDAYYRNQTLKLLQSDTQNLSEVGSSQQRNSKKDAALDKLYEILKDAGYINDSVASSSSSSTSEEANLKAQREAALQIYNYMFDTNKRPSSNIINGDELAIDSNKKKEKDEKKSKLMALVRERMPLSQLNDLTSSPIALHLNHSGDPKELLAFSRIINRRNKDRLKRQILLEANDTVYSTINNSTEEVHYSTTHQVLHTHGTINTYAPHLGAYKSKEDEDEEHSKESILDGLKPEIATEVKGFITTGKFTEGPDTISYGKYKNQIAQLSYLLYVTEMERNKATLFTAPMYLDLIEKGADREEIEHPMAPTGAQPAARGVIRKVGLDLFESSWKPITTDYNQTASKPNSQSLLEREYELIDRWLKSKNSTILDKLSTLNAITYEINAITSNRLNTVKNKVDSVVTRNDNALYEILANTEYITKHNINSNEELLHHLTNSEDPKEIKERVAEIKTYIEKAEKELLYTLLKTLENDVLAPNYRIILSTELSQEIEKIRTPIIASVASSSATIDHSSAIAPCVDTQQQQSLQQWQESPHRPRSKISIMPNPEAPSYISDKQAQLHAQTSEKLAQSLQRTLSSSSEPSSTRSRPTTRLTAKIQNSGLGPEM